MSDNVNRNECTNDLAPITNMDLYDYDDELYLRVNDLKDLIACPNISNLAGKLFLDIPNDLLLSYVRDCNDARLTEIRAVLKNVDVLSDGSKAAWTDFAGGADIYGLMLDYGCGS